MATKKPATNVPTSGKPVRIVSCPLRPNASSASIAIMEPTMNTLKWEKLINSMMP